VARRDGIEINWRPFSVRTLMREQNNSPFVGKPAKMSYMWRDIGRRAERFGLPFNGPPCYPIDAAQTANHVATLAAIEGWVTDFVRAAYRTWFLLGQDPGEAPVLRTILSELGKNADDVLAAASAAPVRRKYSDETDLARELGIFGSPTYVSGTEIFWGDDRLEDAVAWHKAHAANRAA
jgi:2-hydroxychromene-2-carboxylate isomerase